MADITHNDPLVTESKLTEFYNDIKPFLGCPAYVTQEGDAEYYSTDEKVIGRWTDDKPLYQRTLFISSSYTSEVVVPNTGTGVSVSGVTDVFVADIKPTLDKIINIQMDTNNRSYSGSSFHHSYPFRFNKDNGYVATVDNYNVGYQENIALYPGTSFTFKYTKSTDSTSTTIEQKPTHYSTDEQVIGTWIDGKPLYQKTYAFDSTTFPSADANIPLVANIDEIVDYRLICHDSKYHSGYIPTNLSHQKLWQSGVPFDNSNGLFSIINYTTTPYSIQVSGQGYYDWGNIDKAYLTVQYTKTTD